MKICMERFEHLGGVQFVEQDGAKFYDLAGVMDALGVKPSWKNGIEKAPVAISGKIVWGLRMVAGNYIESVFLDEDATKELVNRYLL